MEHRKREETMIRTLLIKGYAKIIVVVLLGEYCIFVKIRDVKCKEGKIKAPLSCHAHCMFANVNLLSCHFPR